MNDAPSSTYAASSGAAYDAFLGRWTRRLASPLIDFARPPDSGDILDVGCGTGSLTFALADRYPHRSVTGIDIAPDYVAHAHAQARAGRPIFEPGDATRLRWSDGAFAAVFAQLVLNFIPDAAAAAREMRRVTRRGGPLIAAVWDFRGGLVYQRMLWDTLAAFDPGAATVRDRLFSHRLALPGGLGELWRSIGLVEVEQDSITIRMEFADFADYWEPLLGGQGPVGTYVQGLPLAMQVAARERVRAAYLSGAADGGRSLTATAWTVRGIVP
ncbi:MAG TPA: methyltransferase domain-containing protein [Methylomirabilota bacterium]|nr:methyltransferase domain-containing protein [Methylomirabilota bacterium]